MYSFTHRVKNVTYSYIFIYKIILGFNILNQEKVHKNKIHLKNERYFVSNAHPNNSFLTYGKFITYLCIIMLSFFADLHCSNKNQPISYNKIETQIVHTYPNTLFGSKMIQVEALKSKV